MTLAPAALAAGEPPNHRLSGVKEEILLSRNVGKNSFDFLVETGGLVRTEQNGQFTLVDPETEQQVGTLGEIIVFHLPVKARRGKTAQTRRAGAICLPMGSLRDTDKAPLDKFFRACYNEYTKDTPTAYVSLPRPKSNIGGK